MSNVVGLHGVGIDETGANPEVVAELRKLLEEAERGDIRAFAIAWVDNGKAANTLVAGSSGNTSSLGGAIGMLSHRYFAQWRELGMQDGGT